MENVCNLLEYRAWTEKINYFFFLNAFYHKFYYIFSLFFFAGLDIRWFMVPHMASCRRLDVHGIHIKFMCHFLRSLRGSYASRYLSQYYVYATSEIVNSWFMGAVIRYLFSAISWMEGRWKGKVYISICNAIIRKLLHYP